MKYTVIEYFRGERKGKREVRRSEDVWWHIGSSIYQIIGQYETHKEAREATKV